MILTELNGFDASYLNMKDFNMYQLTYNARRSRNWPDHRYFIYKTEPRYKFRSQEIVALSSSESSKIFGGGMWL